MLAHQDVRTTMIYTHMLSRGGRTCAVRSIANSRRPGADGILLTKRARERDVATRTANKAKSRDLLLRQPTQNPPFPAAVMISFAAE